CGACGAVADGAKGWALRHGAGAGAVKRLALTTLVASLFLMMAACSGAPAGDETSLGPVVQNRPDGVRFSQQHATLVTRWRPPMDHGGETAVDRMTYRVWDVAFVGEHASAAAHPVAYVWQRGWMGMGGDSTDVMDPPFLRSGGQFVPDRCMGGTIATVEADGTTCVPTSAAPQVQQIGGRVERLTLEGTRITFADGLDGQLRPCTLDLASIAADAAQPISVRHSAASVTIGSVASLGAKTTPGARFSVSYLPPHNAYIVDHGAPDLPLWRATCAGFVAAGKTLPLPEGSIRPGSDANSVGITLLDMVADPGHSRPALFLALPDGGYGHRLAVWREGRAPQIIPYLCHDCLPGIGGFFHGDPDWLLFDVGTGRDEGHLALSLNLFDVARNREVQREFRLADPHPGLFR
ncbi:MAG: hypothetical protein ABL874_09165, partial [Sphingopyxis sp.]